MSTCILCQKEYNSEREKEFLHGKICSKCGVDLIEAMFAPRSPFNEWLDSFLQSRIETHVPCYDEYYKIYKKQKCPNCGGKWMIDNKVCDVCNFLGVIDA